MACNCKANHSISYLHNKYGDKGIEQKKSNIRASIGDIVRVFVIYCAIILATPLIAAYIIGQILFNKRKTFNIGKFFRLQH